jgi:GNAT superfamily N-acetyltransferase
MTTAPDLTIAADDPVAATACALIGELCAEMAARYGTAPSPFSLAEAAKERSVFLVARLGAQAVGCGALRPLEANIAEIKRMYVAPAGRRRGIARQILLELERRAVEFGYHALRLETGVRQPEAQRLYESVGYRPIAAFGPYVGNPTSVCYEKRLSLP